MFRDVPAEKVRLALDTIKALRWGSDNEIAVLMEHRLAELRCEGEPSPGWMLIICLVSLRIKLFLRDIDGASRRFVEGLDLIKRVDVSSGERSMLFFLLTLWLVDLKNIGGNFKPEMEMSAVFDPNSVSLEVRETLAAVEPRFLSIKGFTVSNGADAP